MANVSGKDSTKGRNILGVAEARKGKVEKVIGKDGKETTKQLPDYFIVDMQLDMRDERVKGEINPHMVNYSSDKDKPGEQKHGRRYTQAQLDKIKAAGQFRERKDGAIEFAVKGDVFYATDKMGTNLLLNTKTPLGRSDFNLTTKTMANQAKLTAEAKTAHTASLAAKRNADKTMSDPQVDGAAPEASRDAEMGT